MLAFDTTENVTSHLSALRAKGYGLIGRYYSKHAWKVMSQAEALAISLAGMEIFVVYEDANNSADHFSTSIGTDQATRALQMAKALGQLPQSAIYFAIDYDARPHDIAGPINDYFNAIKTTFSGSGYKIGVYGGGDVCADLLDRKLVDFAWLCQSTGFPGYQKFRGSNRWSLLQQLPATIDGMDCDPDVVNPATADVGQFSLRPRTEQDAVSLSAARPSIAPFGTAIGRGEFNSDDVKRIQAALVQKRLAKLVIDGDFGEATENAVRLFQAQHTDAAGHALPVTGSVDAATWQALFGSPPPHYDRAAFPASTDLRSLVIAIAQSQIGVLEQPIGSNRGPEVDEYLKAGGLDPGSGDYAWCVCFIQWVFREAGAIRGEPSPLPLTAGVHALWDMRGRGASHVLKPPHIAPSDLRPAMIFLIDTGGGKGHAGFIESIAGDVLTTIEGNTNPGGSRDGYGVFRRTSRRIGMPHLLGYLDFC